VSGYTLTFGAFCSLNNGHAQTFTLIAPDTEQSEVDLTTPGPSQGDIFVFSGPLVDASGEPQGRLDGHCITVSTPAEGGTAEHRRQCFATSTIGTANGETEIQAQGVGRIEAGDVLLSVKVTPPPPVWRVSRYRKEKDGGRCAARTNRPP
jgi:hypothetical protein